MDEIKTSPGVDRLAYTVREAAKLFGLGKDIVYVAIKAGELKSSKIGKRRIVLLDDMRTWIGSKAA